MNWHGCLVMYTIETSGYVTEGDSRHLYFMDLRDLISILDVLSLPVYNFIVFLRLCLFEEFPLDVLYL